MESKTIVVINHNMNIGAAYECHTENKASELVLWLKANGVEAERYGRSSFARPYNFMESV